MVVPKILRKDITKLLHETHLGFNKIYKIARELFYWPSITSELKSYIGQCQICIRYSKSQIKKPIIKYYIPKVQVNKVGIDIAE